MKVRKNRLKFVPILLSAAVALSSAPAVMAETTSPETATEEQTSTVSEDTALSFETEIAEDSNSDDTESLEEASSDDSDSDSVSDEDDARSTETETSGAEPESSSEAAAVPAEKTETEPKKEASSSEPSRDPADASREETTESPAKETSPAKIKTASVGDVFTENGITYSVLTDTTVQAGNGTAAMTGLSGTVVIPQTVTHDGTEYTVTAVARRAFMDVTGVDSVTLPPTVTSIGEMAFGRSEISSVNLPDQLTEIQSRAFMSSSLKSAVIPGSVKTIESNAFGSSAISSLTISEGVETIGDNAFSYCASLTAVTIPSTVKTLEEQAFYETSLTSVTISGNGLETIGKNAFRWCANLKEINIPASIREIGERAFAGCEKLTSAGLEKAESSLTSLGESAFSNSLIREITIPAGCTDFSEGALKDTASLTAIHVSEENPSLKDIDGVLLSKDGKRLIQYPASLRNSSYTTPDSVEEIAGYAFASVSKVNSLALSDSVKTVGEHAFHGAKIQTIDMGASVTTIGRLAFQNCSSLYELTLSPTLEEIPEYMLYGCSSLEELTIPASVAKIGSSFVSGCNALTALVIESAEIQTNNISTSAFSRMGDNTVITVETDALMEYLVDSCGVDRDKIVSRHNDPIPEVTEFTTEDGIYCKVLSSPTETENGTVQIGNGSDKVEFSGSTVEIPETVTDPATRQKFDVVKIAKNAFYSNFDVTEIAIPKTVKEIEGNAFYYCYFLEKITFAENSTLETIGAEAFSSCGSLKALHLPASVSKLDPKAFTSSNLEELTIEEGCKAYKTIDNVLFDASVETMIFYPATKTDKTYIVPETVTSIPESAFSGNKNLREITVGKNVKSIGAKAFSGLANLRTVTIESAETMGNMTFYNSSNLSEVTLPQNLKAIPDYMFYNCGNLSEITIPGSVQTIVSDALGSTITDITIESVRNGDELAVTENAFSKVKEASFQVATDSLKTALVAIGVPEENITVDESLIRDGIKESAFTIDGIQYTVTKDPTAEEAGAVEITKGNGAEVDETGTLRIPETVKKNGYTYTVAAIGNNAFYENNTIANLEIPVSVEQIGVNGLGAMIKLESITFAENSRLKTLENGAISDNHELKEISIPASVEEFGDYVLAWNYSLTSVKFEEGFSWKAIPKGFVFRDKALTGFTLPAGTETIEDEAFYNCFALAQIDLSKVKSIGENAFFGCSSLESITLSDELTELESGTFTGCAGLKEIHLSRNLTKLGDTEQAIDAEEEPEGVFKGCTGLTKITVPAGVTQIPKDTFSGCKNLKSIEILAKDLSFIGANAFLDIAPDAAFTVKSAKAAALVKENTGLNSDAVTVIPTNLSSAVVSGISGKTYTGSAQKPVPTIKVDGVTLKQNTDYTVTYKNNVKAGTATVTITGKGDYTGSITKTFKISPASVAKAAVGNISAKTYTGKAFTPAPAVKVGKTTLKKGTDYTLSYRNNVKAGTATVTVTGKGNYTGTVKKTFRITAKTIGKAKVGTISAKAYAGKAFTPAPAVKDGTRLLKKGTDYTLKYTNNNKIGTATVIITGKGNYQGTVKKTFRINPAKTVLKTATAGKKAATVKYTAVKGGVKYQIAYKMKGSSSWKFTTSTKTSATIKKLTSKKSYQIKVRAIKKAGSTTYYGPWSAVKTVTVK